MHAKLIYGAVVRHSNVVAQYYAQREQEDWESLASDLGREAVSRLDKIGSSGESSALNRTQHNQATDVKTRVLRQRTAYAVSKILRASNDVFTFVCVGQSDSQSEAEKFLAALVSSLEKDLDNAKAPPNLSAHCAKKIKQLLSARKDIETGKVEMLEAEVQSIVGHARKNIEDFMARQDKFDVILEKANELADESALAHYNSSRLRRSRWYQRYRYHLSGAILFLVGESSSSDHLSLLLLLETLRKDQPWTIHIDLDKPYIPANDSLLACPPDG